MEDRFNEQANPLFKDHQGDLTTVYPVDGSASFTATMVFNEFVGAIDDRARAIFQADSDDYNNPRRGDRLVLNGRSWFVIDVRKDETATYELRCDIAQEDV